jgi:DMSO/TMAO reductase YedYZ molybdopterin-dependent catalytic subunit
MAAMNMTRVAAGAAAGLLAGGVALGVAELTAAATGPLGTPVVAVGEAAINLTPVPVKEFAIAHFGTHDKQALVAGILVLLAAFAAVTGVLAVRRLGFGLAGLAAFAAVGVAAGISQPGSGAAEVLPTLAGAAAGAGTLVLLVRVGRRSRAAVGARAATRAGAAESAGAIAGTGGATRAGATRRQVLVAGAGAAVVAAGTGGLGSALLGRSGVAPGQVRLPAPAVRARGPAGTELGIPGLTPFVTPNASFYRVDTDLVLPQLSPRDWTLRIDGMVERELEIGFGQLLRMPLTEAEITLVCVSNEVGGTYNGNARWLGVPLAGLLRHAGVRAGADQVLSSAADGMTISTPLATIMDGRNALLAVGMNGQPLPVAHGFPGPHGGARPVRLRVRDQVGHPADRNHVRGAAGVLDAARLRRAGTGQDRVQDRRAQAAGPGQGGPNDRGRCRLGTPPGHRRGRGQRG